MSDSEIQAQLNIALARLKRVESDHRVLQAAYNKLRTQYLDKCRDLDVSQRLRDRDERWSL